MDDNFFIDEGIINFMYQQGTLDNIIDNLPADFLYYMWVTVKPSHSLDNFTREDTGRLVVSYIFDWLALLRFHNIVYDPFLYKELTEKTYSILFQAVTLNMKR